MLVSSTAISISRYRRRIAAPACAAATTPLALIWLSAAWRQPAERDQRADPGCGFGLPPLDAVEHLSSGRGRSYFAAYPIVGPGDVQRAGIVSVSVLATVRRGHHLSSPASLYHADDPDQQARTDKARNEVADPAP
jgi:hypothetical protein